MFFLHRHGEFGLTLSAHTCTGLECELRSPVWWLRDAATVQSRIITSQIYGLTYIWQCRYMTQH